MVVSKKTSTPRSERDKRYDASPKGRMRRARWNRTQAHISQQRRFRDTHPGYDARWAADKPHYSHNWGVYRFLNNLATAKIVVLDID
jgi:hypothetical protein